MKESPVVCLQYAGTEEDDKMIELFFCSFAFSLSRDHESNGFKVTCFSQESRDLDRAVATLSNS